MVICTIVLLAFAPKSDAAVPANKYWNFATCADGQWSNSTCWSSPGQPLLGDRAFLNSGDAISHNVYYDNTLNPAEILSKLEIGAVGGGQITFHQGYLGLNYDLYVAEEYVGKGGTGIYSHVSGVNKIADYLYLGYSTTDSGVYNQSGGSVQIGKALKLGVFGSGTYNLDGGQVSAIEEHTGIKGTGVFNQSGGSNSSNYFYLGYDYGGAGTYELSGGQLTSQIEYIGRFSVGKFIQSGGTNTVTQVLKMGEFTGLGTAQYDLSGGKLITVGSSIGKNGFSQFNHTGGEHKTQGMDIGTSFSSSKGEYNLGGTGILNASHNENVGAHGTGVFNQTGGENSVANNLNIGMYAGSNGTYNLSDGQLTAKNEHVGWSGTGVFNQTGGSNIVSDNLLVKVTSGAIGTYNLSGGSLSVGAGVFNKGKFNYSGGSLTAGSFTNNPGGEFNLSGAGTRIVNAPVTNSGTVKATNTTVQFNGTFTNNGAYISDPSSNYFGDLIIGANGYLAGGTGDKFYIGNNFENHSERNTLWNTVDAYLAFNDGVDLLHDFYLTSVDMGANMSGYADNFAWGTLEILSGNYLSLFSGHIASHQDALYVETILGASISGGLVTNITGHARNIYYLASAIGNEYLGGLNYNLTGSGQLIAIGSYTGGGSPVPEPSTLLLFASGFGGMAMFRRRFAS